MPLQLLLHQAIGGYDVLIAKENMGYTQDKCYSLIGFPENYGLSLSFPARKSWILDSGASDHITSNPSLFSNLSQPKTLHHTTLAYGSKVKATGIGQATPLPFLPVNSVLFMPGCPFNLVYVSQLTHTLNCSITFINNFLSIQDCSTRQRIWITWSPLFTTPTWFLTSFRKWSLISLTCNLWNVSHVSLVKMFELPFQGWLIAKHTLLLILFIQCLGSKSCQVCLRV